MSADDGGGQDHNRNGRRLHAHTQARNDIGSCSGHRLVDDALYRARAGAGIKLGDQADEQAGDQAENDGEDNAQGRIFITGFIGPAFRQHPVDDADGGQQHDTGGDEFAPVEGFLRVASFFNPDEEGAQDGGENPYAGQHQRQQHGIEAAKSVVNLKTRNADEGSAQHHRADDRAYIRFEKVGAHAGHISYVVAHVVGDGCRVQRVVFRNAGFHLAYQVGAYVGSLGVDASPNTGKEGDRRSPKRKPGNHGDHFIDVPDILLHLLCAGSSLQRGNEHIGIEQHQKPQAKHAQADNAHPHDGSSGESHFQGLAQAGAGGVGRAHIGPRGHFHADETR